MASPHLKLTRAGRVLEVEIDDPPYNYFGSALIAQLDELTRQLRRDRSIGAVVISSTAPGSWITHAYMPDLNANAEAVGLPLPRFAADLGLRAAWAVNRVAPLRAVVGRTPARGLLLLRQAGDLFRRMNQMDQVFIAAINGNAFGAGFETAFACDLRVAAEGDHQLGFIESYFGLMLGTGTAQRLARSIGVAETLDLVISGTRLSPGEAQRRGLVHRVVAAEQLRDEAMELAQRLAQRQPETTGALKRALYDGVSRPFGRALTIDQAAYASVAALKGTLVAGRAYERQLAALDQSSRLPVEILEPWFRGEIVDLVHARASSAASADA